MSVPIVVICGQSNAAGRGAVTLIPNYLLHGYNGTFPAVQQRYLVDDGPTDPIVWDFDVGPSDLAPIVSGNGIFGVELSMCRRLYRNGYEHAMAKMAIGSTSLAVHWLPTGTFPTGDNLFTQFLAFLDEAETDLDGTIAEIVWVQGETDAGNSGHAAAYAANLRAFIVAVRVAYPGVAFTINRLHINNGGAFTSTVRAAQDLVSRTVPGVRIFSCDDLPLDGAHFTAIGFMALGERFADQILVGRERFAFSSSVRSVGGFASAPSFGSGYNFPPVASFTSTDTSRDAVFTDTSLDLEGALVRWAWDFGDGDTATTQNPTHTYDEDGTYTVTLTAYDSRGSASTATGTVEVTLSLWTIDPTSFKITPADGTEWTALVAASSLVVGSPEHLWLFQDASGNLAAAVGGKTLTMTGTPLYQQSETGWSRKFIGSNTGVAAANRSASNATMSANTVSTMLLMYARIVQPAAGHQRMSYGGASSNALEGIASSNNVRYRTGASAANGSTSHVGSVQPYVIVHDPSGTGRMGLFTPLERKTFDAGTSPAYAARAGTTVAFTFSLGTDATSNTIIGYGAGWSGATVQFADITAMENAVRALLVGLGWTVVW